jgi:tRNA pseudouridine55 synthase
MDGIINLLKPPGLTSHDCVDVLRRLLRTRRVGHTGTLDPGAAGVLVLCVGAATRLSEFLMEADKAYRVDLVMGVATTTGDALGEVISTGEPVTDRAPVEAVVSDFAGTQQQVPPMVSAVHHQGKRLYELARRGIEVERAAREITVHDIRIIRFAPPSVLIDVVCSKGTYVRQLCHDIGQRLGCGAHAGFMIRTRVGPYELTDSATFEEIEAALGEGTLDRVVASAADAMPDVPDVEVAGPLRAAVLRGQALPLWKVAPHLSLPPGSLIKVLDEDGRLLALGRAEAGKLRPFKVMR